MKTSAVILGAFLASVSLAESITTTVTATKNGHVYTKTVTQDATFVWQGEGSYSSASQSSFDSESASSTLGATSTSIEVSYLVSRKLFITSKKPCRQTAHRKHFRHPFFGEVLEQPLKNSKISMKSLSWKRQKRSRKWWMIQLPQR